MKRLFTRHGTKPRTTTRAAKVATALAASVSLVGITLAVTALPAAAEVPRQLGDTIISNVSFEDWGVRCVDDSVIGLRAIGCNGQDFQRWHINQFANGSYEFINVVTRNCLDDSPTNQLRTFPCNGGFGGYQKWRNVRAGELMNEATGLCLDYSNQFQLRTFGCNGGFNNYQAWDF